MTAYQRRMGIPTVYKMVFNERRRLKLRRRIDGIWRIIILIICKWIFVRRKKSYLYILNICKSKKKKKENCRRKLFPFATVAKYNIAITMDV